MCSFLINCYISSDFEFEFRTNRRISWRVSFAQSFKLVVMVEVVVAAALLIMVIVVPDGDDDNDNDDDDRNDR